MCVLQLQHTFFQSSRALGGYHTGDPGARSPLKIFPCLTFYHINYILSHLLFYFYWMLFFLWAHGLSNSERWISDVAELKMRKRHLNCLTTAEWKYGHICPGIHSEAKWQMSFCCSFWKWVYYQMIIFKLTVPNSTNTYGVNNLNY